MGSVTRLSRNGDCCTTVKWRGKIFLDSFGRKEPEQIRARGFFVSRPCECGDHRPEKIGRLGRNSESFYGIRCN